MGTRVVAGGLASLVLVGAMFAQKPEVRLSTPPSPGAFSNLPSLAANDASVYVAWADYRDGASDVYFQRSLDRGETWLGEVRLDRDDPGSEFSLQIQVATFGSTVYVVWSDFRNGGSLGADILMNVSTDSGATWLTNEVRVNQDPIGTASARCPVIAVDASAVYVAWLDTRNDPAGDIYFNRSADQGQTWMPVDVQVNTDTGAFPVGCPKIALAEDLSGRVYVGWTDFRNGVASIRLNRSLTSGQTWLSSDTQVNQSSPATPTLAFGSLAGRGSNVYVTWFENRNGADDIYFHRSTDFGASFDGADARLDTDPAGESLSVFPEIAIDGSRHSETPM